MARLKEVKNDWRDRVFLQRPRIPNKAVHYVYFEHSFYLADLVEPVDYPV